MNRFAGSIAVHVRQEWFEIGRDERFRMLGKFYTIISSESFKDYSPEMFIQACRLMFT